MKIDVKTTTYGDNMPLKLEYGSGRLFKRKAKVNATLDIETGEVTFNITKKDLDKIKKTIR